ncbi:hypothetical protein [Puniceibacterium confluentis]|uniref:hypothetical protein n=1 Tax=Puniceibacterium confluentis TaxID=1958944 RepID=UPI0011B5EB9C|nr:hypothetical protein [Puniceibacterium confluentis]
MKRTLLLSALALSTLVGAASAASTAQEVTLQRYAPSIEVSALSDAQVNSLLAIAYSGNSEGEKRALIQQFAN